MELSSARGGYDCFCAVSVALLWVGELWRVSEAHNISYYSVPVFWTTMEMTYDLKAQRYYIDGLDNGYPAYDFDPGFRGNEFTASAARRAARR